MAATGILLHGATGILLYGLGHPGHWLVAALAVTGTLIATRVAWVFPLSALYQRRRGTRSLAWPVPAVVSWAGTRGVVPLAAALPIPLTTASGAWTWKSPGWQRGSGKPRTVPNPHQAQDVRHRPFGTKLNFSERIVVLRPVLAVRRRRLRQPGRHERRRIVRG
jgi:hypothetical protein